MFHHEKDKDTEEVRTFYYEQKGERIATFHAFPAPSGRFVFCGLVPGPIRKQAFDTLEDATAAVLALNE